MKIKTQHAHSKVFTRTKHVLNQNLWIYINSVSLPVPLPYIPTAMAVVVFPFRRQLHSPLLIPSPCAIPDALAESLDKLGTSVCSPLICLKLVVDAAPGATSGELSPMGVYHPTLAWSSELHTRAPFLLGSPISKPGKERGSTSISSWYKNTGPVTTVPFHVTDTACYVLVEWCNL